mmetsp:Transcript_39946/g.63126  ORF Transcript_39946/g.63126 Transcript_39946/m.63126 type:complete len:131 (-) Transcript_39946:31-423(-)
MRMGGSLDADMELALRMSLEEENMRQQQAKAVANEAAATVQQIEPASGVPEGEMDPDMALAIRMSLEEENVRQQQQATANANEITPTNQKIEPTNETAAAPDMNVDEDMDEDLELAIKLSLEYENTQPKE